MTTVADITDDVVKRLHQVSGTSVQTYSEPVIEELVVDTFNLLHAKEWWPEYMRWSSQDLDGSTGVIDTDILTSPEFASFGDIRGVWLDGENDPIPRLSEHENPYEYSGTRPLFLEALAASATNQSTRLFRVWPLASTGTLYIHHRFRTRERLQSTDDVYLDRDLLMYGAVAAYLADDGSMPDMLDRYERKFDVRYRDITANFKQIAIEAKNISQSYGRRGIPTRWFEQTP